ncbi:MAG: SoxR reducing system RseC family protein [Fibrobacterota bacterium]
MALIAFEKKTGIVVESRTCCIRVIFPDNCKPKGGCSNCSGCGSNRSVPRITIRHPESQRFETGRQVIIRRLCINEAFSAIVMFGFPLVCALSTLFGWFILAPHSADSPAAILCSVAALIGGFFCVFLFDLLLNTLFPPQILPSPE